MSEPAVCDEPHSALRNFANGSETAVLQLLNTCFGGTWGNVDRWKWKHSGRPGFSERDIKVCMAGGKPVACLHSKLAQLQLTRGLIVDVSMEGDIAVLPNFRRQKLIDLAHVTVGAEMLERGAVLRVGFTSPELYERYYKKRFGHLMLSTVTRQYRKILTAEHLARTVEKKFARLGQRPEARWALKKRPLRLALEIDGFDHITVELNASTVKYSVGPDVPVDATIVLPYSLLAAARGSRASLLRKSAVALLRGQIRSRNLARTLCLRVADLFR